MRKMNDTKKNTKGSTQGSLGSTIRRIRELRGWTQSDLGERIGFSPSTRVVRVGQYENNKQFPRGKTLDNLAKALEVDTSALLDIDLSNPLQMYHALFEMEQYHSIHPECIDGKYVLVFPDKIEGKTADFLQHEKFLEEWYNARNFYLPTEADSSSTIEKKKKAYALWKYEYPNGKDDYYLPEKDEKSLKEENSRLQEEVDLMYAQLNADAESKKIDDALQPFFEHTIPNLSTTLFTFDLNIAVLEIMETGVLATKRVSSTNGSSMNQIVSFRTSDILKNDNTKEKYYKFLCIINAMTEYGKTVEKNITAKNKELYISFWMDKKYKKITDDIYLSEMERLVNRKNSLTPSEYKRKRQILMDHIMFSNISIT